MEPLYPVLINFAALARTAATVLAEEQKEEYYYIFATDAKVRLQPPHLVYLNNEFCRALPTSPANTGDGQLLWTASVNAFIISLTRMTDCVFFGLYACVCVCDDV